MSASQRLTASAAAAAALAARSALLPGVRPTLPAEALVKEPRLVSLAERLSEALRSGHGGGCGGGACGDATHAAEGHARLREELGRVAEVCADARAPQRVRVRPCRHERTCAHADTRAHARARAYAHARSHCAPPAHDACAAHEHTSDSAAARASPRRRRGGRRRALVDGVLVPRNRPIALGRRRARRAERSRRYACACACARVRACAPWQTWLLTRRHPPVHTPSPNLLDARARSRAQAALLVARARCLGYRWMPRGRWWRLRSTMRAVTPSLSPRCRGCARGSPSSSRGTGAGSRCGCAWMLVGGLACVDRAQVWSCAAECVCGCAERMGSCGVFHSLHDTKPLLTRSASACMCSRPPAHTRTRTRVVHTCAHTCARTHSHSHTRARLHVRAGGVRRGGMRGVHGHRAGTPAAGPLRARARHLRRCRARVACARRAVRARGGCVRRALRLAARLRADTCARAHCVRVGVCACTCLRVWLCASLWVESAGDAMCLTHTPK